MKGWNKYCNKCAVLALAVLASGVARCDTVELEVYSDKFDNVQTKRRREHDGGDELCCRRRGVLAND